jgi:hypothetical protein
MNLTCYGADCRIGLIFLVAANCLGCSPESNTKDRYVPAVNLARQAVEEVLVDWREGRKPSPIDRLAVGVQVVDKQRKKGQSLEEYEILGEAPSEAARCFAVHVKLSGPEAEENVRFVVIGIDPLWVFRQEDYESVSQWVCGKPEEDAAQPIAEGAPSDDEEHVLDEHGTITPDETKTAGAQRVRPDDGDAKAPNTQNADAPSTPPPTNDDAQGDSHESGPRQNE